MLSHNDLGGRMAKKAAAKKPAAKKTVKKAGKKR